MPEGHTIHRLAEDQNRDFAGQRLQVLSPQGRFEDGAKLLNGRTLKSVEAVGKHLLYRWDKHTLHVHLGLYGKSRRHSLPLPEPRGQVRLRVIGDTLAFDLNGPTACELLTASEVSSLKNRLGADPLRVDSDPDVAWQKISRSRSSIGALLMDQSVIAGVGNIYRSEILYLLGIHPSRQGNTLSESEFLALWELTVSMLKIGKRYNRIITTHPDEIGKPRTRMNRDERLWIYKKPACIRCGTPIQSWKIAARTVYACPTCQPQT